MSDSTELIRQLIALPGPPGEENAVRDWLAERLRTLGYTPTEDIKGNLLVQSSSDATGEAAQPSILVTAHLDEIALMITKIEKDGKVRVAPMGGVYTWKWGEGPVSILA